MEELVLRNLQNYWWIMIYLFDNYLILIDLLFVHGFKSRWFQFLHKMAYQFFLNAVVSNMHPCNVFLGSIDKPMYNIHMSWPLVDNVNIMA